MKRKGKLYGVGVGPGDPELITLKAVRIIKECQCIAVPTNNKQTCLAYKIASSAVDIETKPCIEIPMPMTRDTAALEQHHTKGANTIAALLEQGDDIAFLTLGDPTIYATYIYIHKKIAKMGYETQLISGIPSFCAAAARLNISLAEQAQELHIIPAVYHPEDTVTYPGTKVFMKIGSQMNWLRDQLHKTDETIYIVENCGMETERISMPGEVPNEPTGYYTTVIAKKEENETIQKRSYE